jgi:hypothetical protein
MVMKQDGGEVKVKGKGRKRGDIRALAIRPEDSNSSVAALTCRRL